LVAKQRRRLQTGSARLLGCCCSSSSSSSKSFPTTAETRRRFCEPDPGKVSQSFCRRDRHGLTKILNFSDLFTSCHSDASTHDCILAKTESQKVKGERRSKFRRCAPPNYRPRKSSDFPSLSYHERARCAVRKIDWNCSVTTIVRVAAQVVFLLAGNQEELVPPLNIPP
jgi:hypothetical protein